ncbi:hypothetical protein Tco_0674379 [Tanacetum coccineum]
MAETFPPFDEDKEEKLIDPSRFTNGELVTSGSAQFHLASTCKSESSKKQEKSTAISILIAEYIALSGCCAHNTSGCVSTSRDYGFAIQQNSRLFCDSIKVGSLLCHQKEVTVADAIAERLPDNRLQVQDRLQYNSCLVEMTMALTATSIDFKEDNSCCKKLL